MSEKTEELYRQKQNRLSDFLTENEVLIREAVLFGLDHADSGKSINDLFIEFYQSKGLRLKSGTA